MCNGFSTRTSQGGTIAVLRPASPDASPAARSPDLRLLFQNSSSPASPRTQAALHTRHAHEIHALKGCWVLVHHDGDLSSAGSSRSSSPAGPGPGDDDDDDDDMVVPEPLHSFRIAPQMLLEHAPGRVAAVMDLPQSLELAVGGAGVVGRRVSIVAGEAAGAGAGARTLAEGVIGWN